MDIIERLRSEDISGHGKYSALVREAAAEIKRLREHKRKQADDIMTLGQEVGRLNAEIERLRAIAGNSQ